MILRIQKSKTLKVFIVLVLLGFLNEIINPLRLYALTSGPSQPEMQGFASIETSDMVDLFTGDFHYNIPLLSVPGPGGEYPIVLNYNAGPTMEQEASWVGLGWSLNVGSINRDMRGIPDDFSGEKVTRRINIKDKWNLELQAQLGNFEIFGYDPALNTSNQGSLSLTGAIGYDSYNGFTTNIGSNFNLDHPGTTNIGGDFGTSWSNEGGFDFSANASLLSKIKKSESSSSGAFGAGIQLGGGYNTRSSIMNFNTKLSQNYKKKVSGKTITSSCFASYVPQVDLPMTTGGFNGKVKIGMDVIGITTDLAFAVNFSIQSLTSEFIATPAYGTLYLQESDDMSLRDYNKEHIGAINKHTQNLPIPVMTQDRFIVSGAGMNGVFVAHRNDFGGFSPNSVVNNSNLFEAGFDMASSGGSTFIGGNINQTNSISFTGDWDDSKEEFEDEKLFTFNSDDPGDLTNWSFEPAYFKMSDELSSEYLNARSPILNEDAVYAEISIENRRPAVVGTIATNDVNNNNDLYHPSYTNRKSRAKSIQYRTIDEASKLDGIYYEGEEKQIHDFTIVNEDGSRYVYGKPLYNVIQKDVMYAIDHPGSCLPTLRSVDYNSTDASTENNKGNDHYFNESTVPSYAYSYLVTSYLSSDYVDLDNSNDPSDGDLGFWVKFAYDDKYTTTMPYKWRMPYNGAYYSSGYISNEDDDKASFAYGEREVSYLGYIETETHIVSFFTTERSDGIGSAGIEGGSANGAYSYQLDEIRLYSKNNTTTPIKTVHFVYDYSLCTGVPNATGGLGKLTLKSIYFTYGNDAKGEYSKYNFSYNTTYRKWDIATNDSINAPFSYSMDYDRWGNYNSESTVLKPYVQQDDLSAAYVDRWAGAWCLSKIELPSGGYINIHYESDDYAYVQDKQAMQMCRIYHLGGDAGSNTECKKDNLKVYFRLNEPAQSDDDVLKYVQGLEDGLVYFKTFMKLEGNKSDYVDGYAEINPGSVGFDSQNPTLGWVELKAVDYGSGRSTHPFRMATWQYLRVERPDVIYHSIGSDNTFLEVVYSILDAVKDLGTLLSGYYNFSYIMGRGNEIDLIGAGPSFIRLMNPNKIKKGGGHRVKYLSVTDDWTIPEQSHYVQEYVYRTVEKGHLISSGVAEYEPVIGGEENPLRQPVFYKTEKIIARNDDLYLEKPFNESYFPAPSVGYSKVLVYTKLPEGVTKTAGGYTLNEFYTAKDFPIFSKMIDEVNYSKIKTAKYTMAPILIPGISSMTYSSKGWSQGYVIELNDMHGKPWRNSTYAYRENMGDILDPNNNIAPKAREEYIYKTTYPFNPSNNNSLDNIVNVLINDGDIRTMELGTTCDFFCEYLENSSNKNSEGLDLSLEYTIPLLLVPTGFPNFSIGDQVNRTIVTNKIIYKNGILDEVRVFKDGAMVSTKNVYYDANTGNPLLTKTTSNYDNNETGSYLKPVYGYTIPAFWSYKDMGPAYKNAHFSCQFGSYNTTSFPNAGKYLNIGDEVLIIANATSYKAWISSVSDNSFVMADIDGNSITHFNLLVVINSGKKNQQHTSSGYIKALTNPVDGRRMPILDAYNADDDKVFTYVAEGNFSHYCLGPVKDCFGENIYCCFQYDGNKLKLFCTRGDLCPECSSKLSDDPCYYIYIHEPIQELATLKFYKVGEQLKAVKPTGGIIYYDLHKQAAPTDVCYDCLMMCLDSVLDAKAIEYSKDNWKYPAADMGISYSTVSNEYASGLKGIYRLMRENLYITGRQQRTSPSANAFMSDVGNDGTYQNFCFFDWSQGNNKNQQKNWKWTNMVTLYSPYGYELENMDANYVFSSALYGYKNTVPVAVASNARYFDIAFDGFEDHSSSSYPVTGYGHIDLNGSTISSSTSHTGKKSLYISSSQPSTLSTTLTGNNVLSSVNQYDLITNYISTNTLFSPVIGKEYLISTWIKPTDRFNRTLDSIVVISRNSSNSIVSRQAGGINASSSPIEGWYRLVCKFKPITGTSSVEIIVKFNGESYLDDLRIQPTLSAMKTYVYDPILLRLVAELDDNNYATFYNYDEEGVLIQVKQETERGIFTVKTSRQNIKKVVTP